MLGNKDIVMKFSVKIILEKFFGRNLLRSVDYLETKPSPILKYKSPPMLTWKAYFLA
jgi:hypothetical protein